MKSHKIACVMPKIISGWGALPQTQLEELITQIVGWGGGKLLPKLPPQAFPPQRLDVSLRRIRRLKSNVPLPKQFSGSAPAQTRIL